MLGQHTTTYKGVLEVQSDVFRVELVEDDGRWSAGVSVLPGCATWGYSREAALHNIRAAVEAYRRDMHKAGEDIPQDAATQVIEEPVVAVTR